MKHRTPITHLVTTQQSALSQPNQTSSSRPGAYPPLNLQSNSSETCNYRLSFPHTPAQVATSKLQSLTYLKDPLSPHNTPHGTSSTPLVLIHHVFHPVVFASWATLRHCQSLSLLWFIFISGSSAVSQLHVTQSSAESRYCFHPVLLCTAFLCCTILEYRISVI